jgi:hypothetical protein
MTGVCLKNNISILSDNNIDFSKDEIYQDTIKINTNLIHHQYKNLSLDNRRSIENYFTINKNIKFRKIFKSEHYVDSENTQLKKMLYCFKINKDINKSIVVCIFRLKNGQFAIITYNVNLIPSPVNMFICYAKYYIEVLMYIFKLESEMKMDTKHSHIVKYPKCFFKNFGYIFKYFSSHMPVDQDHS